MDNLKTITEQYNALPFEVRDLCSQVQLQYQYRDLLIERQRAIKHHKAHLKEICAHIKNVKKDMVEQLANPSNKESQ